MTCPKPWLVWRRSGGIPVSDPQQYQDGPGHEYPHVKHKGNDSALRARFQFVVFSVSEGVCAAGPDPPKGDGRNNSGCRGVNQQPVIVFHVAFIADSGTGQPS